MKKKKVLSDGKLTDKLDAVVSELVRRSAADWRGYVSCVTCGKTAMWNEGMQCGHYVTRGCFALRFDLRNCHVQCRDCNVFKHGNMDDYALFMVKKYGLERLNELKKIKSKLNGKGPTRKEKLLMLEYYEARLKQLRNKENSAVTGTKGGSGGSGWVL